MRCSRPRGGSLQLAVASFAGLSCAAPPLGGGTDVQGGLLSSQSLASVPLCLTSPSVVQISFLVQLGGPLQVAALPAWPATGLVLSRKAG